MKDLELDLRAARQQLEFDHGRQRTTLAGLAPMAAGSASTGPGRTRPIARIAVAIAILSGLVVVALIAGTIAAYLRLVKPSPIASVAVLPFVNTSGDPSFRISK